MIGAARLEQVVVPGPGETGHESVAERGSAEDHIAPARGAEGAPGLRLDERKRMDRAVADMAAGQPGEVRRLIVDLAIDVHDRDLLERHDVGVERGEDRADPLQAILMDMTPPGGRERLTGTDRGADVPGHDPNRARPDQVVSGGRHPAAADRRLT